jgi:hypothetical protein
MTNLNLDVLAARPRGNWRAMLPRRSLKMVIGAFFACP